VEDVMAKRRKPTLLEVGKAYRMWLPFAAGPSEQIAVITRIEQATKTTRLVHVEWLLPGPGWRTDSYSHFLNRVYCEEPKALH
jgi:hypothetical protein